MLHLSLVTPSRKILNEAPIEEIFVPAFKGELNILEGHASLISTLITGRLRYRLKDESEYHDMAISWGYLEVSQDHISVLAETAEDAKEIDIERASAAKLKAEQALQRGDLDQQAFAKYQMKVQRAQLRLDIAGTSSTSKNAH